MPLHLLNRPRIREKYGITENDIDIKELLSLKQQLKDEQNFL